MKGFKAILVKECRHIIRDPKVLVAVLLMPVVLVLLFGYTIKNEINNARFAVLDNSKSVFPDKLSTIYLLPITFP